MRGFLNKQVSDVLVCGASSNYEQKHVYVIIVSMVWKSVNGFCKLLMFNGKYTIDMHTHKAISTIQIRVNV